MSIHETGPRLRTELREGDGATEAWRGRPSRPELVSMSAGDHDGGPSGSRRLNAVRTQETPETPESRAARTKEIKFRILEGAYDSLEAVDQLARRILASGDM